MTHSRRHSAYGCAALRRHGDVAVQHLGAPCSVSCLLRCPMEKRVPLTPKRSLPLAIGLLKSCHAGPLEGQATAHRQTDIEEVAHSAGVGAGAALGPFCMRPACSVQVEPPHQEILLAVSGRSCESTCLRQDRRFRIQGGRKASQLGRRGAKYVAWNPIKKPSPLFVCFWQAAWKRLGSTHRFVS